MLSAIAIINVVLPACCAALPRSPRAWISASCFFTFATMHSFTETAAVGAAAVWGGAVSTAAGAGAGACLAILLSCARGSPATT
jgi:hypothetical protein